MRKEYARTELAPFRDHLTNPKTPKNASKPKPWQKSRYVEPKNMKIHQVREKLLVTSSVGTRQVMCADKADFVAGVLLACL
jgi:hypothetical protein